MIFGEAGPEAAAPLPDGRRVPVDLRMPKISATQVSAPPASAPATVMNVAPTFNVGGSVSADDLTRLKAEIAHALPGVVQAGITNAFDRNQRFRRSGI